MKIEIDFLEGVPYIVQMEAIDAYIKQNTTDDSSITETKGLGMKIQINYRSFYIWCRKTRSGIYKFKVGHIS